MHRVRAKFLATIAAAPPILAATTAAHAETTREWAVRALNIQAHLDDGVPLPRTTWVGTHNSFANPDDDNLRDYNQHDSLKKQLRAGVREIVFDVHYEGDKILLCHNNSSVRLCMDGQTGNRKLSTALDDLKAWIRDEGNSDQVVLLKIELADSARRNVNKVEKVLDNHIASFVYRTTAPAIHGNLDPNTGCTRLDTSLTKQKVLDAGKNIIMLTTLSCISDGGFNDLVFYGDNVVGAGGKVPADMAARTDKDGVVYRVKDGATNRAELGDHPTAAKLKPDSIAAWLDAGLNIVEMYGFGAPWTTASLNDPLTRKGTIQPEHMVWSWPPNYPAAAAGDHDCALIQPGGALEDTGCTYYLLPFACYNEATSTWSITTTGNRWREGFTACPAGSTFRVPTSKPEFNVLRALVAQKGVRVWVNYTDAVIEGEWVANAASPAWLDARDWSTSAVLGGSGGSGFDDREQLVLDLYRADKRRITKIEMYAGNRIDMVRFTYSDGRQEKHGKAPMACAGSICAEKAPNKTHTLAADESIVKARVCRKKHKGSTRVFYLKFTTNLGNTLVGANQEGTCEDLAFSGREIYAMRGRSGESLDAIGFYFRER